jgi:phage terminase large subunit
MPFTLTKKQSLAWHKILANPLIRRVLFDGGTRSSKTFLICAYLANEAALWPGAPILIARKYRDHAKDSIYKDTLRKLLQGRPEWEFKDGDLEVHHRNGSFIRIGGLDDKERSDKVLGTEYAHIFFNEATQLTHETVTTVLTRLASNAVPVRKAIFDCNPKSQRHWLYRVGVQHVNPETGEPLADADAWARMHWTPYDNPHLAADYLATLESMTGVQRRRMLDGEWCEAAGAVYEEFDEDVHVIDAMPSGWESWRMVRGIDFGFTNPFVCIWGAVDDDGRLYICGEHYKSKMIVRDHAAVIRERWDDRVDWTVSDHDAEDRATLHAEGIVTTSAHKDVLPGINAVKARLRVAGDGRPRLFFLRGACPATIAEMYDYAWAPESDGKNSKEEPVKDRDHAMDALRYIIAHMDGLGGGWGPSGAT